MTGDDQFFTDAELWQAINEALGENKDFNLEPRDVDPGTVTGPELSRARGFSDKQASKVLRKMAVDGIVIRDMVYRIDAWTGAKVQRKGYRYVNKGNGEEKETLVE